MNFEKIPRIWLFISGAVYLIGLVLCLPFAHSGFMLGFGLGGALALVNSWLSARKIQRTDFLNRMGVVASVLGGFYVRLIILGLCLYGLIRFSEVDPLGLIIGLSVIPAGLFVMLILIYIANRRPEEA